jgi:hypothetical protein
MINFETNSSPFFVENKIYCETIENSFKIFEANFSGYCNSYGYKVETTFKKETTEYNLTFTKFQTTQNGVILPVWRKK